MRKGLWTLTLVVACVAAFGAEKDFATRVQEANQQLRDGNHDAALASFEALVKEQPNSPEAQFGLGCAQYEKALEQAGKGKDAEAAQRGLESARDAFEKAGATTDRDLKTDAGYNRANTLAQMAKAAPPEAQDSIKDAYARSINAYESFLRQHPGHPQAQHNLDHMRYALKRQLQQPQEQQKQQGGQQNKEGDSEKQESQGGSGSQQNQDQQDRQKGESQSEDSENSQQDQNNPENGEQKPDEQNANRDGDQNRESDPNKQPVPMQQKAMNGAPPPSGENVEAILESLEERDHAEQKDLRKSDHDPRVRKEWW